MGKNIKKRFDPWIERINQVFVAAAGSLIVIMGFLSTYGAIRRYAFRSPEPVSYEFSCMFLLISFVLAIAAVERQDRLLRCDILLSRFPNTLRNVVLNIIGPIMGMTFFGIITWISFGDALRALEIGQVSRSSWPVPLFPVKLFIPIGYGFLCLVLLVRLVFGLLRLKKPRQDTEALLADDHL
jgi:TRAP-type mannitol/chloroaromatic compound transport system permease small subunit